MLVSKVQGPWTMAYWIWKNQFPELFDSCFPYLNRSIEIFCIGREGYLSWPQEPTFPTNHWKVHFAGALSEGRGDVDAFHDFLMPAARRDHVFWGDHPMSPTCIRRLGSCCYGQSHSEWWKLFKSPKTSVKLESLAWNMLVHWDVWVLQLGVLTKCTNFTASFSNQICLETLDSRCCFNPCDSGLNQTRTKSSSEVLHFRLQLSWSLHLSGELCEGCCIPLKQSWWKKLLYQSSSKFAPLYYPPGNISHLGKKKNQRDSHAPTTWVAFEQKLRGLICICSAITLWLKLKMET